jgi:hypothetical protein
MTIVQIETGFIAHDMPNELSIIKDLSEGKIKISNVEDADLDDVYQGAFLSSNDDVLVTFDFDADYLKTAYHILGYCQECKSTTIYSFDQDAIDSCPVTNEKLQAWVLISTPWNNFKQTEGFSKLMAMSQDELDDFSYENHWSELM